MKGVQTGRGDSSLIVIPPAAEEEDQNDVDGGENDERVARDGSEQQRIPHSHRMSNGDDRCDEKIGDQQVPDFPRPVLEPQRKPEGFLRDLEIVACLKPVVLVRQVEPHNRRHDDERRDEKRNSHR